MNFLDKFAIVTNESAPADEKFDANAELFRDFLDEAKSGMAHSDDVRALQSHLSLGKSTQILMPYERNLGATNDVLEKAFRANPPGVLPVMNRKGSHRSYLYVDELGIISGGHLNHWVEKMSPYGFTALKMMVESCPILNAAIITRIRQLNSMSCIYDSQDEHPLGFVCIPKEKKVGDKLTDEERKIAQDIQAFIMNCGDEPDPRKRKWIKHRDNMSTFIGKLVRDTLSCDAAPIETEFTQDGSKISGIYNIPCETIRIAHEEGYLGDDRIVALQIFNDMVCSFYTPNDIIYEVRNPRTDIHTSRYGYGETEMVVRLVTGFLNALTYNQAFFDRNNIPRGILTVFGNFDQPQLNDFKRMWNVSLSGPAQRWRLPVFVSPNKEASSTFTKIDADVNEMMFAKWMTFLISIVCAIYGLSPEEINADSFTSRSGSALSGQDTTEKLAEAKDKGLEPLASHIEGIYNEFIIPVYNDKFIMRYMGLHPEDRANIFEMKKLVLTVNEGRHMLGADEMEDPDLGEAPLNPQLMQVYQGKLQQEQQEAMGMGQQAQDMGLPQDVLNNLGDEEEGGGEQQGGDQMAGRQNTGMPQQGAQGAPGAQALAAARKAQEKFLVVLDKSKLGRYDGWTL